MDHRIEEVDRHDLETSLKGRNCDRKQEKLLLKSNKNEKKL